MPSATDWSPRANPGVNVFCTLGDVLGLSNHISACARGAHVIPHRKTPCFICMAQCEPRWSAYCHHRASTRIAPSQEASRAGLNLFLSCLSLSPLPRLAQNGMSVSPEAAVAAKAAKESDAGSTAVSFSGTKGVRKGEDMCS